MTTKAQYIRHSWLLYVLAELSIIAPGTYENYCDYADKIYWKLI